MLHYSGNIFQDCWEEKVFIFYFPQQLPATVSSLAVCFVTEDVLEKLVS